MAKKKAEKAEVKAPKEFFRGVEVGKILKSGDEKLIEAYKDKYGLE